MAWRPMHLHWGLFYKIRHSKVTLLVSERLVRRRVGSPDASREGVPARPRHAGAVGLRVAAGEGRPDPGGVRDAPDVAAEPTAEAERYVRGAPDAVHWEEAIACKEETKMSV